MEDETLTAGNTGLRLIRNWHLATNDLIEKKRELDKAQVFLMNQENELIKWAVPKDIAIGEKILIPVVDGWLCIEPIAENDSTDLKYKIYWRNFPKEGIR